MADAKSNKKAALFYTPTSCGAASFIAAHRAGLDLDAHQVNLFGDRSYPTLAGPKKFADVNPKGNVPTIVLADGTILNENAATLAWIADQNLSSGNGAAYGTSARYELQNVLAWLASELHAAYGILFGASQSKNAEHTALGKSKLERTLKLFENTFLGDKSYLIGKDLTVADIYAHIVLGWSEIPFIGVDLKPYPKTLAFLQRVRAHPDVVAAQKAIATNPQSTKAGAPAWTAANGAVGAHK